MTEKRYNLFEFAPGELSHSAFWAWVLQCTDSPDERHADPKALGLRLLRAIGAPEPGESIEVKTEVKISGRDRLDIWAKIDGHAVLAIENKVSAIPDGDQLERYKRTLLGQSRLYLALLSTAFDAPVRAAINGQKDWQYLGVEELLALFGEPGGEARGWSHPLIIDYHAWLRDLNDKRAQRASGAISDGKEARDAALATYEGQWALLAKLMEGVTGEQYQGTNNNGTPWTQFKFVKGEGERDSIFYRIDCYESKGQRRYYLSLRQYQKEPFPSVSDKRQRLNKLRNFWDAACSQTGAKVTAHPPHNRGDKESEIGVFLFDHNPPNQLLSTLPLIHREFHKRLVADGSASGGGSADLL